MPALDDAPTAQGGIARVYTTEIPAEESEMTTYRFTFTLKDQSVCSNDMADAIYAAGGDDATVASRDGVVSVHFDREADSMDDAVRSAAAVITAAGYAVDRISVDEQTLQTMAG